MVAVSDRVTHHLLDGPFCEMGNEICAMETPEYADIWCLLMPLFPPAACSPTVQCVPVCLVRVLFTPQAACLLPLSRQPDSHSSYEPPRMEGSPRSANTWLSLHVHSHLIMGEALTSQSFQHVGTKARRKQQSHKTDAMLNSNSVSFCVNIAQKLSLLKEQNKT